MLLVISSNIPLDISLKWFIQSVNSIFFMTRPPTLRHLLTMTAGLGYEDTPAYEEVMDRIRKGDIKDLAGLCDAISDVPLQAEPGSRYESFFRFISLTGGGLLSRGGYYVVALGSLAAVGGLRPRPGGTGLALRVQLLHRRPGPRLRGRGYDLFVEPLYLYKL